MFFHIFKPSRRLNPNFMYILKKNNVVIHRYIEVILFVLISAFGIYARFPDFPQPYLWLDEAWRGLAIISCDSPKAIVDYMSTNAEVILLSEWLTGKIAVSLIPDKTLALRIVPLFFSVLCSVSIFQLSKSISKSYLSILPLVLINGGYLFILHSREFKPYIIDLLFTSFAYYLTILACNSKISSSKRATSFLCIFLFLFSLSSLAFVFVTPSLLIFLWYKKFSLRKLILISLVSFIPFLVNYYLYLSPQSPEGTQEFWSSYYLSSNLDNINFFVDTWIEFISQSTSLPWQVVSLSFFILLPIISIIKKDGIFLLFLSPFLIQCCLSYLHIYPLFQRPSYYLYGLAVISLSYSISCIFDAFVHTIFFILKKRPFKVNNSYSFFQLSFLVLLLLIILKFTGFTTQVKNAQGWPVDQGREIMKTLTEEYKNSDNMIYNQASYFTMKYYAYFLHSDNDTSLELKNKILSFDRDKSISDDNSLESLSLRISDLNLSNSRVWILSTHVPNITQNYLQVLNEKGRVSVYVDEPYQRLILLES